MGTMEYGTDAHGREKPYPNSGRDDVAGAFAARKPLTLRSGRAAMFTDGRTVWSYGHHWPIAEHRPDGTVGVNEGKSSRTTAQHTGAVKRALRARGMTPGEETYRDRSGYLFRIWS